MVGRARLRVKDNEINSFRVLDNLSGNRLYFLLASAIHEAGRSSHNQVSWISTVRPSSVCLREENS